MSYQLICFDVDGTIIQETVFVWQTIHDHLGTDREERRRAAADYTAGRMSYADWADHDVKLWRQSGAGRSQLLEAIAPLRLMDGARETLETLRQRGLKLAIISGSIDLALEKTLPDYEDLFDYVFINRIRFDGDGTILGIEATPFDIERKGEGLLEICRRSEIDPSESVFVGDHYNDVEAARVAGLSIAFGSKSEELMKVSDVRVESGDLRAILPHIS